MTKRGGIYPVRGWAGGNRDLRIENSPGGWAAGIPNSEFRIPNSLPCYSPRVKATVSSLKQARQIRQVFGPVLDRLDEVNTFFDREFQHAQPMVRDVATYVLGNGGKRL